MRSIIHIDMDAFFAAVEQMDQPAYRGKPVIVGGDPHSRGVVSTCSYEARRFGVRSAMPLREALRRCPQGIFVPCRMGRYHELSCHIMTMLREYTPLVEPLSVDEAFMDVTGCEMLFGTAEFIARTLVRRIQTEIGLTASIGVAPNKFLAKLASDLKKPQGFVVVSPETITDFLAPLPVSRLWGVGPRTEERLHSMGIQTIGALAHVPMIQLRSRLGETGEHLYRLANGQDDRPVLPPEDAKSIGQEVTFQRDIEDREVLQGVLLDLADRVARRVRQTETAGRTITVKMRDADFKTITRSRTLAQSTCYEEEIYRVAMELAEEANWGGERIRLLGVSLSHFEGASDHEFQLSLFDEEQHHHNKDALHQAMDRLRDRYGHQIITRGRLVKSPSKSDKDKG